MRGAYNRRAWLGRIAGDGAAEYAKIDRCPGRDEIGRAYEVARYAGLRRFDGL